MTLVVTIMLICAAAAVGPLKPPMSGNVGFGGKQKHEVAEQYKKDAKQSAVNETPSGSTEQRFEENDRDSQPSQSNGGESDWHKDTAWIQAGASIVAAGLTLGLFIIGVLQWKIYEQLRRDNFSVNRAFVHCEVFTSMRIIDARPPGLVVAWRIHPVWRNIGNTHTMGYINFTAIRTFPGESIPESFEYPNIVGSDGQIVPQKFIIGPKQSADGPPVTISVDKCIAIQRRLETTIIYGWAEYTDVFEPQQRRRTEFCARLVPNGFPEKGELTFGFPACGPFNGADDQCYRKPGEPAPTITVPPVA